MLTIKKRAAGELCTAHLVALALLVGFACAARSGEPFKPGERPPAVAGQFYPGEEAVLRSAVKDMLSDALPPRGERPIAIVVPHAGYVYSGQIAADAFRQAQDYYYDLIVVLATNHTVRGFEGVSVFPGNGFRTPLGVMPIDAQVTAALRAADPAFAAGPEAHVREHSAEVQVPFLQVLFPNAKLVAAVVGEPDMGLCRRFGQALAKVVKDRKVLIVASSDLSHYPAYDDAVAADRETLTSIASLDPAAAASAMGGWMRRPRPGLETAACGAAPILATLSAAKELGATKATVISYANSGDTLTGDPSRCVGYGAVVLSAGAGGSDTQALERPKPPKSPTPLTPEEKKLLLGFARKTLERSFGSGMLPLARGFPPSLSRMQGAFVTLTEKGQLRGCIGHMAEDKPLGRTVGEMALQAAFNDRRFKELTSRELPLVEIEISVLTPFAKVPGPESIAVGRDGVLLEKDGHEAVYLPQVAPEQGWNRDQMLDNLCQKAGLDGGCWRKGAELSTFQADVFHEGVR